MKPICKLKLSDLVSKHIREKIISGQLKSGDRIVETYVAETLGVSQSPVREALYELEVMGLVKIIPYRGCYVLPIDKVKLLQIYSLRKILECFAAEQGIKDISDESIKRMEDYSEGMHTSSNNSDVNSFVEFDVLFHNEIVKSADNIMLEKMWNLVGATHWSNIAISTLPSLSYSADSHLCLLEMARTRDTKGMVVELTQHFANISEFVVNAIVDEKDTDTLMNYI